MDSNIAAMQTVTIEVHLWTYIQVREEETAFKGLIKRRK